MFCLLPLALLFALQQPPSPEPEASAEEQELEFEDEVVVTATRSDRRVQDQALRVEVLGQEEIEEKLLMTPGDIAMLLSETGGLRVQLASPALGAANVKVQGLRGRYTQFLADGLPLYGGQAGSTALLQIPPLDLGQVEVIKGVASALYGSSALGGVINLVARRPPDAGHAHELLLNRTSRAGTDGVAWLSGRPSPAWGLTFLGGLHAQEIQDVDGDGWADLPHYLRGVARPRASWQDAAGRSLFLTVGALGEHRDGGTLPGASVPDGEPFDESLETERYDFGASLRLPAGGQLFSVRASAMTQRHEHLFGDVRERDRHRTAFLETALTGTRGRHAWVAGAALQLDDYQARDVTGFDYDHAVASAFVQDDVSFGARAVASASLRYDHHDVYGDRLNPRASLLFRPGAWSVRASLGGGYFAPTPFTEETEAVGLSRLRPLQGIRVERAVSASLDAGRRFGALELHATGFASRVRDPILVRDAGPEAIELVNAPGDTRAAGAELLLRLRAGELAATATYTFLDASEIDPDTAARDASPLLPRHAVGLVAAWERHGRSRVGLEAYYTGAQRLDDNPYRERSEDYFILGVTAERRFGRLRVFLNGENLTDTRQTRHDPLLLPARANDGSWTVDAWAPLDGRTLNAGVRLSF